MRRALLTVPIGVGIAWGVAGAASSASDHVAVCLATPVHAGAVRAGPVTGLIDPSHDVVNGRFRLHVGAYRDRATGLSQKIPWFLPLKYRVGAYLVIRARRLAPAGGSFTVRLPEAGSPDTPNQHVFPSALSPPKAGCWRLSFQTRLVQGRLLVRVTR